MNTSIKKALCLTLILSLSAQMQAGWWDTLFTKRNAIIAGIGAAAVAAVYFYINSSRSNNLRVTINGASFSTAGLPHAVRKLKAPGTTAAGKIEVGLRKDVINDNNDTEKLVKLMIIGEEDPLIQIYRDMQFPNEIAVDFGTWVIRLAPGDASLSHPLISRLVQELNK